MLVKKWACTTIYLSVLERVLIFFKQEDIRTQAHSYNRERTNQALLLIENSISHSSPTALRSEPSF